MVIFHLIFCFLSITITETCQNKYWSTWFPSVPLCHYFPSPYSNIIFSLSPHRPFSLSYSLYRDMALVIWNTGSYIDNTHSPPNEKEKVGPNFLLIFRTPPATGVWVKSQISFEKSPFHHWLQHQSGLTVMCWVQKIKSCSLTQRGSNWCDSIAFTFLMVLMLQTNFSKIQPNFQYQ